MGRLVDENNIKDCSPKNACLGQIDHFGPENGLSS